MTLITHFRTKNHVVVASDSMETKLVGRYPNRRMESWKFSKVVKLIINRENSIVALYGANILNEEDLFSLSAEDICTRLNEIPAKRSSTGILFIETGRSQLIYKLPEEVRDVICFDIENNDIYSERRNDELVRSIDEIDDKLIVITHKPIFFNEQICRQPNIGGYQFLFNHQFLLMEKFKDTWRSYWPEFILEIETTEEQIITIITSFYDKVYADWKLHRDCIGGDIQIAIMNQNGEIKKYSYARDLPLVEAIWKKDSTPESRRSPDEAVFDLSTDDVESDFLVIPDENINKEFENIDLE